MTLIQPPFVLANVGATHTASNDRMSVGALLAGASSAASLNARGGVAPALGGGMVVSPSTNLTLNVASGICYIPGTQAATQGVYICTSDATFQVTLDTAHGSLPRIDRVIARVQDSVYSGALNTWTIEKVTGTAAGSPAAPALPVNSIPLALVNVAALDTSISVGEITDDRDFISQGVIPCKSTDKPALNTVAEGQVIVLFDTGEIQMKFGGVWVSRSYATPIVNVQTIQVTGNYTKPAGAKSIWARGVGGGGAGGGSVGGANVACGGSGAAGGYCETMIDASTVGATIAVTIGTGGTSVVGGAGIAGGNTTFGSHFTASGGGGGTAGVNAAGGSTALAGVGGAASGANILNRSGDHGVLGRTIGLDQTFMQIGASSQFGAGGQTALSTGSNGAAATGFGAGGGNAIAGATSRAGGNGTPGLVIVTTYF